MESAALHALSNVATLLKTSSCFLTRWKQTTTWLILVYFFTLDFLQVDSTLLGVSYHWWTRAIHLKLYMQPKQLYVKNVCWQHLLNLGGSLRSAGTLRLWRTGYFCVGMILINACNRNTGPACRRWGVSLCCMDRALEGTYPSKLCGSTRKMEI